jgi:non-ribosomal peptide synthetase component F
MSKGALGLLAAYWPEDTPRYAHIPLKTIGDVTIYRHGAADRAALVSASGALTYGVLAERSRRFADCLRGRVKRASRVAILAPDAARMLVAAFGAFDAEALIFLSEKTPSAQALQAFEPELIIAPEAIAGAPAPLVSFEEVEASEAKPPTGRPDIRTPLMVLAAPDGRGEVQHSHRSLVASAVSTEHFYMFAEEITLLMVEPPTRWYTLALMLGALQRGATVLAGWEENPPAPGERVDYVACGWDRAVGMLDEAGARGLPRRIAAGLIAAIEGPFSVSRRLRLARKLGCDILTLFGRSDTGPLLASHPGWFLNEAAGIPMPNVDLRPLNPADGTPLNIGWEVVERAEIGAKSALAPAGAATIEGWLRTGVMAEVDPTGFYFLHSQPPLRMV